MTEWQSIETAPKDGTTILIGGHQLLHAHGFGICTARWQTKWEAENGDGIAWWKVEDGKFGPYDLRGPSPTHWMPLPDPPSGATR